MMQPNTAAPTTAKTGTELVRIVNCRQAYHKESATDLVVLDGVNLSIRSGEIVGLLGRSGSGKSTLLRIIAGLLPPTSGEVIWKGRKLEGPADGISMVFQSFALFPWLTVQKNVELGLEAQGVAPAEREKLAEDAIHLIGLGGYENAYPKELSGGMRQRVGLARALVVRPDLLLMDEPFSALDVLTAENLRTDLVELWAEKKLPIQSILLVTHNIEEAVLMCDRILIFSSNPGRVAYELQVPFEHPRNREDMAFRQFVDRIYALMTRRAPVVSEADMADPEMRHVQITADAVALPALPINTIVGMMETLAADPLHGRADLPLLASRLQLELDDLFPLGESLQLLGFAELEDGDILLTPEGLRFVQSEHDTRKTILRASMLHNLPMVRTIRAVLDERPNHRASAERFRDELEDSMSPDYARQTLQTLIGWARYAELFDFDEEADQLFLEDETE
ncbi:nitrate ABC transporter ATP-binding protein [Komagataeibacter rhaeticus]|uniref:Nitrate/sulfonate/bicarbonate ABC transporter ATP-binding protein n=1 Tax=Komagataeibacter rhaeticus TaxID=215221 RepID=A0A181C911_9PROT|nr:nitrate/sulfonate/bicarbonate ABC transporter ATP-binding protein [Komagataeibacter rhaeticus]ATU72214.1 nitrate ABC transporter ATP-binding protein [Komagataeibacter xylinus]EGG75239.1 Putative nitrate transport ATP-binding protein nrtD [Gluconacetobacter sp. SXCC-1]KDU97180.1 nitrate ABC transporter ATP-binding protein [Komagataeibacter rhaeticus AF1]MBL7241418.1 nitrate/sulfonate/bicarbonate ABC transporter ATP-binding protein [Komagataeibacter rhaeticus]PYD53501.1 nitrate ABC transporte